jgi:proteasome lid subunit RPN8/RPN11
LLNRLKLASQSTPDREVCGLLIGRGNEIIDAVAVPNVARNPAEEFMLDPASHLRASRALRSELALIGHYHSHLSGCTRPSSVDAVWAHEPGVYWLILANHRQELWISRKHGSVAGAFEAVELQIVENAALQPPYTGANRGVEVRQGQ